MKTVLITGGSRGIGREMVRHFSESGFRVVFSYLNAVREARELGEQLRAAGGQVLAVEADVSRQAQVDALVRVAEENFGGVDVLVNNAGISQIKLLTDLSEEEWDTMLAVNLKSVFLCSKRVLPAMIAAKQGKIINIASIWGQCGASCEVHYSVSKAGVIGFTRALAREVGPSGIQVNCVSPGVIDTEMNGFLSQEERQTLEEGIPLGRFGHPREVADVVLFLASPQADYMTGQVLAVNGGEL